MYTFQTETVWRRELECGVSAQNKPDLTVAAPPEFGGPEGVWSPEELFVASIGSCLLSTFLYFAHRFQLAFESYSSTSAGKMEKTSAGLRFTEVRVSIALTVSDEETLERVSSLRLQEKLEKYCPVSASLNCPVELVLETTRDGEPGAKRTQA
jgi:organic hydroperoxide reductase OsmC/OhrA